MIGSSHWHSPIYLDAAREIGHELILFDPDRDQSAKIARRYHATSVESLDLLLSHDIDFAIVLGKHTEMSAFISRTIDAGIPFLAEKPAGLEPRVVRELADRCEKKNLFNAAAFPMRWDSAMIRLRELIDSKRLGRIARIGVSYFAGPKSRYLANGCPWVLEREIAGGGALINVGTHVIDLLRFWGFEPEYVSGSASWELTRGSVEDISTMILKAGPTLCLVESGYLCKNPYNGAHITLFAENANLEYRMHELAIRWSNGSDEKFTNPHHEPRNVMLRDLLERADAGDSAPATLHDMAAMLDICKSFYSDLDRTT